MARWLKYGSLRSTTNIRQISVLSLGGSIDGKREAYLREDLSRLIDHDGEHTKASIDTSDRIDYPKWKMQMSPVNSEHYADG
jgi:hypothetical protein